MLLAAHALDLGAVWTTLYPIEKKMKGLAKTLKLPGNLVPFSMIKIGYPAESPELKDKWDVKKITYGIPE